ncbi:MAG: hypothetical protein L0Y71_25475 [Gemmataceae bacterium]|nr:hypothetical protein [Gemmataceae bacterium]
MDIPSISGPPCPMCHGSAFTWQPDDDMLVEIGDARYHPWVCAECGNIQLVLTATEISDVGAA